MKDKEEREKKKTNEFSLFANVIWITALNNQLFKVKMYQNL